MIRPLHILSLLCSSSVLLASAGTYGLGTSWMIGQGSASTIQKVTTTFNPGSPPAYQLGSLILYPALSNGTGDLLRTSLESWPVQLFCGGSMGQWCIRTMVYSDGQQINGPFAPLDPGQAVTITFERYQNKSGWTQTASVNGAIVSQLEHGSGPMSLFGMTTECDSCAMASSTQTYTNTTIILEESDATWSATSQAGSSIYGTYDDSGQQMTLMEGMSSSDDGSVWHIDTITIPAYGSAA